MAALWVAGPASAHEPPTAPTARADSIATPCPGAAMEPHAVMTGAFPAEMQGSYVMVPFTVPSGTTAVRVKYCFDQPEAPTSAQIRHTLDLGLYDARVGEELWGPDHFRGHGGSSHPDVWVSPEGFKSEQEYLNNRRSNVAGKTTRGFLPGPIQPGVWAAELGLAAIADRRSGDQDGQDGQVAWRVEVFFSTDPAHADEPYAPAPYDETPARSEPGWYAGDLHVHAEHSALGDATYTEAFDYAFNQAGLDFVTLSEYVTRSGWGEIGRHQARYPGKLVTRSSEVITYRGHVNSQTAARYVDHRTGPVWELAPDGKSLLQRRTARPASAVFDDVLKAGGFTQVNHPTIFPSEVPGFSALCRGCPWDYSDEETQWEKVNAYEVHTGPAGIQESPASGVLGPNPFTPLAVAEYERLLAAGHHIAAVAASDSHNAGGRNGPTQSPIGQGHTVVYAEELSEAGLRCGVQAGHTYAKVWGADRPDIRLEATAPGVVGTAIFGDTLRAREVTFTARVIDGSPEYTLQILKDGTVIDASPGDRDVTFASTGPGRYGLRLMRGTSFEAVSTPIWVEDPGSEPPRLNSRDCRHPKQKSKTKAPKIRVLGGGATSPRGRVIRVHCRLTRGRAKACRVSARAGRTLVARGRAPFRGQVAAVRLRLTPKGERLLRRRSVKVRVSARATRGAAVVVDRRTMRLRRR